MNSSAFSRYFEKFRILKHFVPRNENWPCDNDKNLISHRGKAKLKKTLILIFHSTKSEKCQVRLFILKNIKKI